MKQEKRKKFLKEQRLALSATVQSQQESTTNFQKLQEEQQKNLKKK